VVFNVTKVYEFQFPIYSTIQSCRLCSWRSRLWFTRGPTEGERLFCVVVELQTEVHGLLSFSTACAGRSVEKIDNLRVMLRDGIKGLVLW